MSTLNKLKFLSGNAIKILAAIAMVIDHVGLFFFPTNTLFRKIGRLAFPLFAFLLAEGCKYTRDRKKHFLLIFTLALICQLFYLVFMGDTYLSVLVTLTLAESCIFALQDFKKNLFDKDNTAFKKALCLLPFIGAATIAALVDYFADIDYGFWGCMLPVFVSLTDFRGVESEDFQKLFEKIDRPLFQFLGFALGVAMLVLFSKSSLPKIYALFSLLPVLFYNGKRGKWKLKYFFYLFYPLHLVILEGIYLILFILQTT